VVDFPKLRREVAMGQQVTTALADTDVSRAFVPGAPLITFADVVAVEATTARALTDIGLLGPTEQAQLEAAHEVLAELVAAGAAAFAPDDWAPAFGAVLTLVDLLTSGLCDGYLAN
jgi:hypothetical protein